MKEISNAIHDIVSLLLLVVESCTGVEVIAIYQADNLSCLYLNNPTKRRSVRKDLKST